MVEYEIGTGPPTVDWSVVSSTEFLPGCVVDVDVGEVGVEISAPIESGLGLFNGDVIIDVDVVADVEGLVVDTGMVGIEPKLTGF